MKPQNLSKTCPSCGLKIDQSTDLRLIPFCSDRCKYVDLSKWFKEEYSIAAAPNDDDSNDSIVPDEN